MGNDLSVIITGGTGLIGQELYRKLHQKGYHITLISRNKLRVKEYPVITWEELHNNINIDIVLNADFIIHLAGTSIGEKRWTRQRKKEILDSRIQTAQTLFDIIKGKKNNLQAFITASAIGYYGIADSQKVFVEDDPPANDFAAEVCRRWENVADSFSGLGIRTVKIRTGIVLTKNGGALKKVLFPVKFRIALVPGIGSQYFPWIHSYDLCAIYEKAVEDHTMEGVYNAVAPHHITFRQLLETLEHVTNKKLLYLSIPAVVMKLFFGEMANMLLSGNRISSEKLTKNASFEFKFHNILIALRNLFLINNKNDL